MLRELAERGWIRMAGDGDSGDDSEGSDGGAGPGEGGMSQDVDDSEIFEDAAGGPEDAGAGE